MRAILVHFVSYWSEMGREVIGKCAVLVHTNSSRSRRGETSTLFVFVVTFTGLQSNSPSTSSMTVQIISRRQSPILFLRRRPLWLLAAVVDDNDDEHDDGDDRVVAPPVDEADVTASQLD